jgi:CRP/FNR family transcriptional regulator, cyclic AMP receptor protein
METILHSSKARLNKRTIFNAAIYLASTGVERRMVACRKLEKLFCQGDVSTDIFYLQSGRVKLSVINEVGKEAVVAILGARDFFGQESLAGESVRTATATAMTPTNLLIVGKAEMLRVLHHEHAFSDFFVAYMLARNIRVEQDLVDQLFNSSEKRLARTLLLLANYGKQGRPQETIPKVSQEMLAEMIGTTRSRVNFFMNKFRNKGFIEYGGAGLHVHGSLLNVVLNE